MRRLGALPSPGEYTRTGAGGSSGERPRVWVGTPLQSDQGVFVSPPKPDTPIHRQLSWAEIMKP